MKNHIEGTLLEVRPTEQVGAKNTDMREFIIETQGDYPQKILFKVWNDRCKNLDNLTTGKDIRVGFYISSRYSENHNAYFYNLNAVDMIQSENGQPQPTQAQPQVEDDVPL